MTDYTLHWTNDALKSPFTLTGGTINSSTTSLQLTGKGATNWGMSIQEDLIWLLENFASNNIQPSNPTIGQLWFNATNNYISVYDGANWDNLAFRDLRSTTAPTGTHIPGDLWYDTTNDLLKVYTNGATWIAVSLQSF